MRCKNTDCLRTMRSASKKTKETGFCGVCRKKIEKENENKLKVVVKRIRHKPTKQEQFDIELKRNKDYRDLVEMFNTIVMGKKANVK